MEKITIQMDQEFQTEMKIQKSKTKNPKEETKSKIMLTKLWNDKNDIKLYNRF